MKTLSTRTLTGLFVILLGVAFLLSNINALPLGDILGTWWPLAVVAVGVLILASNTRNYLWASLVILVGIVLQLDRLDVLAVNPWQLFWPVVIILVGISMLFSRVGKGVSVNGDRQNVSAVLGGNEVKVRSDDYKGSKVTAVLGGAVIDLRKAVIKKEATLDLFSFWGGIEIRVPKDVVVRNDTSVILGGVEDKSGEDPVAKGAPALHIVGDIVMAGVEIRR